ncbi:MAG: hypothetical protein J5I53_06145 [Bradyrhizobiaceae bacterium]|nr:hypothetical protein [Bradyrhizobiaceae bacterium]
MRLSIVLVAAFCIAGKLLAQVDILYPQHHQRGVERSPEILIRAPGPIIPSSVSTFYPNSDPMGMVPPRPTVLVVDTVYQDMPINTQVRHSAHGTYVFKDPRTIAFTPTHLVPGRTYRVNVDGMWANTPAPMLLPAVEATFTVAPNTPKVSYCSVRGHSSIGCADNITVEFTEPLDQGLADAGRIMVLECANAETNGEWVVVTPVLHVSGAQVRVQPEVPWKPGDNVRLNVNLSRITGDVLDDAVFSTMVRRVTTVHVEAIEVDGKELPAEIVETVSAMSAQAAIPSTFSLSTRSEYDGRYRLVEWRSSTRQDPLAVDSDLAITCDNAGKDIYLQAVFDKTDTLFAVIDVGDNGSVSVYDNDHQLLRTIDGLDTILITDQMPTCTVVAQAASGYTFQGWQGGLNNTYQNSSPVVGISGAFVSAMSPPVGVGNAFTMRPNFGSIPATSEVYRLSGAVSDVDQTDGWDPSGAVRFTTQQHFVGAVPVYQTLCIEVDDCWEITGYVSSIGGVKETFDEPVQQACATEPMNDPENIVTFLVQRKPIQLRLEKVLMASDDPENLLSPETLKSYTSIRVQLGKKSGSKTTWTSLTEKVCYDNKVQFALYRLHCGDVVRLTIKEGLEQTQKYRFFDAKQDYVLPTEGESTSEELNFYVTITPDAVGFDGVDCAKVDNHTPEIRSRACFRQNFGIDAYALKVMVTDVSDRSSSRFEWRWFDVNNADVLDEDEPQTGRHIEYIPLDGTTIKIRFSQPIDQTTILEGGIKVESYGNVLFDEPMRTDLSFSTTSQDGNVSFEGMPGYSPNTVVLSINDPTTHPRKQALHMGLFKVTCTRDIKSLSGVPLEYVTSQLFQSLEIPGFSLRFHEAEYEYDGDTDYLPWPFDGEIYHAAFGGDFGKKGVYGIDQGFQRIPDCSEQQGVTPGECTLPHSDEDGPQGYGDMLLLIQPQWLEWGDLAWWHVTTYDEDCKDENDCFVNRVQDLLDMAKKRAADMASNEQVGTSQLKSIADLGVEFVRALLPADEQDDHLGYGTFIGSINNLWGTKKATTYLEIGDENTTYRLLPHFLVRRGVIR